MGRTAAATARSALGCQANGVATTTRIEEPNDDDLPAAFPVVRQLREHLDLADMVARVRRQRAIGYRLFVARDASGTVVGAIGMRPVDTLARGHHLHVDDLVVDAAHRSGGIGAELMAFAERWAAEHGQTSVFLDSRPEAMRFYARLGYAPHTATLVRKKLGPT